MSHATDQENVSTHLSDLFQDHKEVLWAVCYRMTGCAADADDIVQETFARALDRATPSGEMIWRPWLIRVATNLSIDLLRQRRRRRYQSSWLPSPIEIPDEDATADIAPSGPEARYEWRESLSFAFLLTIEALSPRQRAVLIFRDVFDYSARTTAELLKMSERNVRITHLRARRAMQAYDRTRRRLTRASCEQTTRLLQQFIGCLMAHDVGGATALLTESVHAVTDGGEYTALRRPMVGREAVLTLYLRVAARRGPGARVEFRMMNGAPAVLVQYASAVRHQAPRAVIRCEVAADGCISELHTILASRKLTAVLFSGP